MGLSCKVITDLWRDTAEEQQTSNGQGHVVLFHRTVTGPVSSIVTIEKYLLKYGHDSGYLKSLNTKTYTVIFCFYYYVFFIDYY